LHGRCCYWGGYYLFTATCIEPGFSNSSTASDKLSALKAGQKNPLLAFTVGDKGDEEMKMQKLFRILCTFKQLESYIFPSVSISSAIASKFIKTYRLISIPLFPVLSGAPSCPTLT
jgi:hypothetical protein